MLASLNQGTQSLGSMFRVQENDMRKSGVKCQGEIDLMGHCVNSAMKHVEQWQEVVTLLGLRIIQM